MTLSPFFTVHSELDREGPGEASDVVWAVDVAGARGARSVADVACGPGADMAALLAAMPDCVIEGVDKMPHFVAAVAARFEGMSRVTVRQGDMAALTGSYDLIWCAGAIYFLGVEGALKAWRGALAPGGAVAFSAPCLFEGAGEAAHAFWGGDAVCDAAGIAAQVAGAGYVMRGSRVVSDAAWEAYYQPMEARIAALRPGASPQVLAVIEETEREIAGWRALKRQTGYLACVVAPA